MKLDSQQSRTSTELLVRWVDFGDERAWSTFDERYRSILLSFFRRSGSQPAEAADLTQDTLLAFLELWKSERYQRERGSVRSLLLSIASHRRADYYRRRQNPQLSESVLEQQPANDELEEAFEKAWTQHISLCALEQLRRQTGMAATTIRAFELNFLEERTAADVAQELGMSLSAVYVARHRCLEQLNALSASISAEYDS
jgi:RNA polymerase sigma-70 factor (ECF subfamily)